MSIFDFLRGEFIDVIHWTDDTRDTIVWRFEREGHAIKYGAKLTVREGQAAVFVHEGQLADTFGPGLYELETNNMPILTTLQHWDHGFKSPFLSEIYFVNTRRFTDLKWGTRNPITCRDPEFGMVRLRAYGTYTMRVADPAKFLTEIVGTDGEFTTEEIEFQIRNIIVTHFSQIIATSGIPVLDMAGNTLDLAKLVHDPDRADGRGVRAGAAGLLHREHLAARRGRDRARQAHRHRHRRRSLEVHRVQRRRGDDQGRGQSRRRRRPRRGARRRHGHGDGRADGARSGPWGAAPAGAAPPPAGAATPAPPPGRRSAGTSRSDGQATGPYTRDELGRMAAEGAITPDSYLWTPGGPDWRRGKRRDRARRPLQRAAAAARRLPEARMELGPVDKPRRGKPGAAPLPLPDLRLGPALRAGRRAAAVRRTAATRRRSRRRGARSPSSICAPSSGTRCPPRRWRKRASSQCPSCGAQIEFDADAARPGMPVLRLADRHRHRRQPPDQAAGAAAVPARRGAGARGDEPLARAALVRAERPQGIRPRRPRDAGDVRPLLDLRRRDRRPSTPASAARSTTRPARSASWSTAAARR